MVLVLEVSSWCFGAGVKVDWPTLELPHNNSTKDDPITRIASGTPVTIFTAQ